MAELVTSWETLMRKARRVAEATTEEEREARRREWKDYEYLCLASDRMIIPTYAKLLY